MRIGRSAAIWFGIGLIAATGVLALNVGGPDTWRELGVPVITPRFADARILTAAAECDDNGFDPLEHNPCDAASRVLNYPRVWISIADVFGRSVDALAAVFSLAFVIGLTVVFRKLRIDLLAVVVFALAVFSPPAMLGLERGNNDLLVVGLVVMGAVLVARRTTPFFACGAVVIAVAAALKLYPVAVLPMLFAVAHFGDDRARRRRNLLVATATSVATIAVFAAQASDIQTIFDKAARPSVFAYGFGSLQEFVRASDIGALVGDGALYFVIVVVLVALIPLIASGFSRPDWPGTWRTRPVAAFRGLSRSEHGGVFLSGFLLFAVTMALDNYPYKLVILALLLPQCVHTLQSTAPEQRAQRGTALALIVSIGALWIVVPLERGLVLSGGSLFFPGQAFAALLSFVLCIAVLVLSVAHALATFAAEQQVKATA